MTMPTPPAEPQTEDTRTEETGVEAIPAPATPTPSHAPNTATPPAATPADFSGVTLASLMPPQARHDLRNYVGQVIGYSELWLDETEADGETPLRQDLQRMYAAGKQILAMVNSHVDPIHPRLAERALPSLPSSPDQASTPRSPDRYKSCPTGARPPCPLRSPKWLCIRRSFRR